MNVLKPISLTVLALFFYGCGAPAPKTGPDEAALGLITRLREGAEAGRIAYGHQDDLVYGHAWRVEDVEADPLERSDVRAVCGAFPLISGFDLGGIELGDPENLDGVPFSLMRRAAIEHSARGGIVTFSWHPRNPLTGGDAWDISSDKVVASVLKGGEKHELFLQWLDRAADFLLSLKDAEGAQIPVVFRPWHENVGSWFWWGGKLCTPDQYRALYAMTRGHFVSRGLTSLVWAYSPDSDASAEEYMERYPGDECVDIMGTDCYEYVGERSLLQANEAYQTSLRRALDIVCALAAEHGKVAALSETGLEGIVYPEWWTGVLLPVIREYPLSYVLTWRNAWDKPGHFYGPFPGSVDSADFGAFASAPETLFL